MGESKEEIFINIIMELIVKIRFSSKYDIVVFIMFNDSIIF